MNKEPIDETTILGETVRVSEQGKDISPNQPVKFRNIDGIAFTDEELSKLRVSSPILIASYTNKRFVCPVCHARYGRGEGLEVVIPRYAGSYCLACWAKWISENVPRLVEDKEAKADE